jgi:hypothetical protein
MNKQLLLVATLCLATTVSVRAQNTYPWSASGNVGIGTTNPRGKLDVAWPGSGIGNIYFGDYTNGWAFGENVDASMRISRTSGTALTDLVTIQNAGNVGIGTTNPRGKLDVAWPGSGTGNIYFGDYANGWAFGENVDASMRISRTSGTVLTDLVTIQNTGNVGIGTTNPSTALDVSKGGFVAKFGLISSGCDNYIRFVGTTNAFDVGARADGTFGIADSGVAYRFIITQSGNVGIGTTNPAEKLSVNGKIRAREVIVETAGWSDYVFADDYKLQSLSDVEVQIKTTKHLPGVPSAQEVTEKGVSVGDMQAILLSKVEELTLHVISQEKRLQAVEAENAQLKAQLK